MGYVKTMVVSLLLALTAGVLEVTTSLVWLPVAIALIGGCVAAWFVLRYIREVLRD